MDNSFEELKQITDDVYEKLGNGLSLSADFHQNIVGLLSRYNISLRQDDGGDPKVTISHPTSLPGSMVVGVRYTKKDGTKTEDHFLFQQRQPIEKCYGKKLERLLPEYGGAHKLQR